MDNVGVWIALATVIIGGTILIFMIVFGLYEFITAPLLDSQGRMIEDKYGRCGPKFKQGDPIPPEHRGKRYW